jgi:hypothetical protein
MSFEESVNNMTRNEALLIEALGRFVDLYDRNRATWPDDMADALDNAHRVVSEVSGLPRGDYGTHVPEAE